MLYGNLSTHIVDDDGARAREKSVCEGKKGSEAEGVGQGREVSGYASKCCMVTYRRKGATVCQMLYSTGEEKGGGVTADAGTQLKAKDDMLL